jgi:lambda family phage portal protein
MVRNFGYAKNAIRHVGNSVVGTGILASPVSKTKNKAEEDKVKQAWKDWAETTDCDFDGLQNFYGIQKMVAKTVAKSGSCLVRRVWKKYKKGSLSLELQVLEPDFLDRSRTGMIMDNGEYTFHGIQFDKNGKRIAYWIYDRHPLDFKVESHPVPADDIAHVFDVEDPGQIDGLPFLSSVIVPMKDYDEYVDAQLLKQKTSAAYAGFITKDADSGLGGATPKPGEPSEKIESGTIQELNPGETITFSDPPSTEGLAEFARESKLQHAAGIGLSYESYTGDLSNVNFSSGRMGWIKENANVEDWQWNIIISMLNNRVWVWFTKAAYLSGLIPNADIGVTWTPPRRTMIDPVKETTALSKAVRNGFISWQDAVRSLGYNPEEMLEEMKKDAAAFDAAKLMPECDPRYDDNRINDPMTPGTTKQTTPKPVKKIKKV